MRAVADMLVTKPTQPRILGELWGFCHATRPARPYSNGGCASGDSYAAGQAALAVVESLPFLDPATAGPHHERQVLMVPSLGDFHNLVWFVAACAATINKARTESWLMRPEQRHTLAGLELSEVELAPAMLGARAIVREMAPAMADRIPADDLRALLLALEQLADKAHFVSRAGVNPPQHYAGEIGELVEYLWAALAKLRVLDTLSTSEMLREHPEATSPVGPEAVAANGTDQPAIDAAKPANGSNGPKLTVNERMAALLAKDPKAKDWTAQGFADSLECAKSTISATPIWKGLMAAREAAKRERQERDAGW